MDTILDTELPHPTQEYFAKISTPERGRGGRWWSMGNRRPRPKGGRGKCVQIRKRRSFCVVFLNYAGILLDFHGFANWTIVRVCCKMI